MKSRSFWPNLALLLASLVITLGALEIVLRFLPVSTGLDIQPVNEQNPYFHGRPHREFVFSRDWNFSIVNHGRTNAQGWVNEQDYDPARTDPLLSFVGDSMVEALMVPFWETAHGRLARKVEGKGRVYSFAFSGAPLSQYLAWAKHAAQTYRSSGLVIVVVGNDFDESVRRYAKKPGFHQYDRSDEAPDWRLVRNDYVPSPMRHVVNASSLLQYLYRNVQVTRIKIRNRIREYFAGESTKMTTAEVAPYEANVPVAHTSKRLRDSQHAVDLFLRDIVAMSGLPRERILFVVDGLRNRIYRGEPRDLSESFAAKMFAYFLEAAQKSGFEVIDMHDVFAADFALNRRRFEFATDGHWSDYGHRVAAAAIVESNVFRTVFGQPD